MAPPSIPLQSTSALHTSATLAESSTNSLLLHESTGAFVRRLKTRGYPVNLPLRDFMACERKGHTIPHHSNNGSTAMPHTADYWLNRDSQWLLKRKQLAPEPDATLSPEMYCALLCGLHELQLDYVDLAIVLHGMSPLEIRNLYRYCYLEWIARHPAPSGSTTKSVQAAGAAQLSSTVWPCTPREFKNLPIEQLRIKWAETLRMLLGRGTDHVTEQQQGTTTMTTTMTTTTTTTTTPQSQPLPRSQRTRSLFFVNRVYSYLTPCG
jgi:hypothetical protein